MENILQEYREYLQSKIDTISPPPADDASPKDAHGRLQRFNDALKAFLDDAADKANTYLEDDDLMVDKDELHDELQAITNEYYQKLEGTYTEA